MTSDDLQVIPFRNFNTYGALYIFPEMHLTFYREISTNEILHHKDRKDWQDHIRKYLVGNHHFPGPPNDTRWIVSS